MFNIWRKTFIAVLFLAIILPTFSIHAQEAALEQRIIASGYKYLGVPYQWGASPDQTSTFDCSSYTQRVFAENGITIPRTSLLQYDQGTHVDLSDAQAGDLVFFNDGQANITSHVGIYMGDMQMLSATVSKGTRVVDISTSYWMSRFIAAKNVLPQTNKVIFDRKYHIVQPADSLWIISQKYGVSIQQLQQWNQITNADLIYDGSQIYVES